MPGKIHEFKNIKNDLKTRLSPERYRHSLDVAQTAFELAIKENEDRKKAYLAGLIHDMAKNYDYKKLKKLCSLSKWEIDKEEWLLPKVLHAPAGAYLARNDFGITDISILKAVRYHSIGHPKMDMLAKIIFTADYIEPGRGFAEIEKVRRSLEHGLDKTIFIICSQILNYNLEKERLLHPNTVLLRNECLRRNS